MYVKISSIVSSRFHQKALILLWNSQFMICWSLFFFRLWTFPGTCFNCEGKLFIQGGAEALPTIQWTAQSMLNISNCLSCCIKYDVFTTVIKTVITTVITTVWLSTDSSGVDGQWRLPQTDWPNPHTPTDQQSKWAELRSPNHPFSS